MKQGWDCSTGTDEAGKTKPGIEAADARERQSTPRERIGVNGNAAAGQPAPMATPFTSVAPWVLVERKLSGPVERVGGA